MHGTYPGVPGSIVKAGENPAGYPGSEVLMANYSKARPSFKPNLDMYRKSKWAKFKEVLSLHLSNLKRFIAKVSYKINEKGSQRLTIMIVPHSEKKIVNIQISNYILFFSSLMLAVVVTTSIVAISNNQQNHSRMVRLVNENKDNIQLLEDYKKYINSVNHRMTDFKTDFSGVLNSVGKDRNVFNYSDISTAEDNTNGGFPKEVKVLRALENDLEVSKNNIHRLGVFVAQQKRLLQEMPSAYPLAVAGYVSSPFGYRLDPVYAGRSELHPGVDLATLPGVHVLATADGVVTTAGWNGGYGFMVELKHKYGISTRYGHMMMFAPGIEAGAQVKQGQTIGYVGSTGKSTGYHLHYEVRIGDSPVNPEPYTTMNP
jgi:murein DD-endopeptidase MepM/ murein hydrolase activator NlpD